MFEMSSGQSSRPAISKQRAKQLEPRPVSTARRWTNLIQLIEIPQNDHVIGQMGKQGFPHLPSSGLFVRPGDCALRRVARLSVVTAEESLAAVDDVFRIHPVPRLALRSVAEYVDRIDVGAPGS